MNVPGANLASSGLPICAKTELTLKYLLRLALSTYDKLLSVADLCTYSTMIQTD